MCQKTEQKLRQKTRQKTLARSHLKNLARKNTAKGQVIVEYVLLLLVSSVMALVLINLVSVDPRNESPVFGYWKKLIETIGEDIST